MFFGGTGNPEGGASPKQRTAVPQGAGITPKLCLRERVRNGGTESVEPPHNISAVADADVVNETAANDDSPRTIDGNEWPAAPFGANSCENPGRSRRVCPPAQLLRREDWRDCEHARRPPDGMRSLNTPQLCSMAGNRISTVPMGQSADVPADRWDRWRLISFSPHVPSAYPLGVR
jgi:hypothetical protein